MRFLANESFPGAAVCSFHSAGHDVVWLRTEAPGASDPEVLAWAARDARILLTFDKDFGELARASALPATCGVVLLRIPMPPPTDIETHLADLITARDDRAGHFSVVEPGRISHALAFLIGMAPGTDRCGRPNLINEGTS